MSSIIAVIIINNKSCGVTCQQEGARATQPLEEIFVHEIVVLRIELYYILHNMIRLYYTIHYIILYYIISYYIISYRARNHRDPNWVYALSSYALTCAALREYLSMG